MRGVTKARVAAAIEERERDDIDAIDRNWFWHIGSVLLVPLILYRRMAITKPYFWGKFLA